MDMGFLTVVTKIILRRKKILISDISDLTVVIKYL